MTDQKTPQRAPARADAHTSPDSHCSTPELEGAHAATLKRFVDERPPFRPEATPEQLVDELTYRENRIPAFLALYTRGAEVLPAVREGLTRANWQVRRWCAALADNFADVETLRALVPLLHDPKSLVRLWAVHSLSCESCKDGPNPIDAVPLLLERIERDDSIRARRQAAAMLAHHRTPDPRVLPVFKRIISEEGDRKLRLHAERGLGRCAEVGLWV